MNKEYDTFIKMLNSVPDNEYHEMKRRYKKDLPIMKNTFPRGRFRMWEDGKCAIVVRNKSLKDCAIFVYGKDKFSLKYGNRKGFLDKIPKDLILRNTDCGDEGWMILKADPRLETALPQFSLGRRSGRPFTPIRPAVREF